MAKATVINIFSTLRAAAGLSLFETADYLNVSQKNVERWVDGVREPPEAETLKYRETVTMGLRKFMMLRMSILTS